MASPAMFAAALAAMAAIPVHAQHRLVKEQVYEWSSDATAPAVECRTRRWGYDYIGIESGGLWFESYPTAFVSKESTGSTWLVRELADGEDAGTVLRTLDGRSEVWTRSERPSSEWFVNEAVARELVWRQWVRHWCMDEDDDGYCDGVEMPEGETVIFVPMGPQDRNRLAQCLNRTRQTKSRVVRRDYLVSGAPNWPALATWHDSCALNAPDHRVPPIPDEPTDRATPAEWCASFFEWRSNGRRFASDFSEGGRYAWRCDLAQPHDIFPGYTGRQVRKAWMDARGEFDGFECPDVRTASGSAGTLTVHEMRYDTSGLREPANHDDIRADRTHASGKPRRPVGFGAQPVEEKM